MNIELNVCQMTWVQFVPGPCANNFRVRQLLLVYHLCLRNERKYMLVKFSICFRIIIFLQIFRIQRLPCTAAERSGSIVVLPDDISFWMDKSFSFFFFFLLVALALESPHMFVPPCVEGMFKKVMPCRVGPSDKFNGTPSH